MLLGFYVFILVFRFLGYMMNEQKIIEYYVKYFGEKFYNYFILFFRKDDFDDDGVEFMDKLKIVFDDFKVFIIKCGGRVIVFNN